VSRCGLRTRVFVLLQPNIAHGGVAPFAKATTLRFELRLALNADRPTESINTMTQEY
jgi:hypothetical protein